MSKPTLRRNIGFTLLTLYGLGTILGAGIYVLIGEVASSSGSAAPSAFLLSAILAGVTAFSYAELSSRLPRSAGEAAYVEAGFRHSGAALAVGWAVIVTGIVSAATMTRGFVGYLDLFVDLPPALVICTLVVVVAAVAAWGISQSLILAGLVTIVEVAGLIFVCVIAGDSLSSLPDRWTSLLPGPETASWFGLMSGAFIAFYAFIGFEDMVNVAEEVKEPEKTLPRAIVAALAVSTAIYVLVSIVAVLSVPISSLAESEAPLAMIVESRGVSPTTIGIISLFAVINGALVQMIMASRVLYGLADQNLAWRIFAQVNATTRTPVVATAVIAGLVMLFALALSLDRLARVTSFIALGIFVAVNASLWRIKRSRTESPPFTVPTAVPVAGVFLCGGMMIYQAISFLNFIL